MTRLFTLFDKKAGKIVARYQQVFGIKRLIERINQKRPRWRERRWGDLAHHRFGQVVHHGVPQQGADPA